MTTTRMKVTEIYPVPGSATAKLVAERSDVGAEPVNLTVLFIGDLETLAPFEPGREVDVSITPVEPD